MVIILIVMIIPLRLWCGRDVAVRSRTIKFVDVRGHLPRSAKSDVIDDVAPRLNLIGLGRYDWDILRSKISIGGRRVKDIFIRRGGGVLYGSDGLLLFELHSWHLGRNIWVSDG